MIADGVAHQFGGGTQLELLHRRGAVGLDRLDADLEQIRNLLVDLALGDQLDDFALAVRQDVERVVGLCSQILLEQGFGHAGREIGTVDRQCIDRGEQVPLGIGLEDEAARASVRVMIVLMYALVAVLVLVGYFTPAMLIVFFALRYLPETWKMLGSPRPSEPPAERKDIWPLWFVAANFYHNRVYGMLFLLGLIADAILRNILLK